MFKLGLIINPLAGIGGSVALKGSDGAETVKEAFARGAVKKSADRTAIALQQLLPYKENIQIITASDEMGQATAEKLGFNCQVIYSAENTQTNAQDTHHLASLLKESAVDLILFQ